MSAPLPEVDTSNPLGFIIVIASIILVPLLSFFTARTANRQESKKQAAVTAQANKVADTAGWTQLIETTQNELSRLSGKVEDLEKQSDLDRQRIIALEQAVRDGETKYRVALQYIRDIIEWTKLLLHSENVPPKVPTLIETDLAQH